MDYLTHIPENVRKVMYTVLAILGLLLGATTTGLLAAGVALPLWLIAVGAGHAFLASALGLVAKQNVTDTGSDGVKDIPRRMAEGSN